MSYSMKKDQVQLHFCNSMQDEQGNAETPQVTLLGTNTRAGVHAFLQTSSEDAVCSEAEGLHDSLSCKAPH